MRWLQERGVVPIWASLPAAGERGRVVPWNDAARKATRAARSESADLYAAFLKEPGEVKDGAGLSEPGATICAETLAAPLRRALFSRSSPWAEPPIGEARDPARLLADPALLAAPMELPEAKNVTATVYRPEKGGWQFNLHSFIAHHDGKFWAAWSSGRVDEDSSSQFIRYATSVDGLTWSDSAVLAPDPDGDRWMASGIYPDGGRLFALGSLNQGHGANGGPWSHARLVRFEGRLAAGRRTGRSPRTVSCIFHRCGWRGGISSCGATAGRIFLPVTLRRARISGRCRGCQARCPTTA